MKTLIFFSSSKLTWKGLLDSLLKKKQKFPVLSPKISQAIPIEIGNTEEPEIVTDNVAEVEFATITTKVSSVSSLV